MQIQVQYLYSLFTGVKIGHVGMDQTFVKWNNRWMTVLPRVITSEDSFGFFLPSLPTICQDEEVVPQRLPGARWGAGLQGSF